MSRKGGKDEENDNSSCITVLSSDSQEGGIHASVESTGVVMRSGSLLSNELGLFMVWMKFN